MPDHAGRRTLLAHRRKLRRPKGSLGVSRLDGKEDESRRSLEVSAASGKTVPSSEPTGDYQETLRRTHSRRVLRISA